MKNLEKLEDLYKDCIYNGISMNVIGTKYSYSEFKDWAIAFIFNYIDSGCYFDSSSNTNSEPKTDNEVIETHYKYLNSHLLSLLGRK